MPPGGGDRVELKRPALLFNIEEDEFPFEDNSFDVVLFCEMLEHLLMDPVAALRQIHRVLRPGVLVLTTPNVSRLDNAVAMVNGVNIYDPYSGYGPYGRHNREYNRHELHHLLEFAGFDVEASFTADGHGTDHTLGRASAPSPPWWSFGARIWATIYSCGPAPPGLPGRSFRASCTGATRGRDRPLSVGGVAYGSQGRRSGPRP